jgi:hypothetical protein
MTKIFIAAVAVCSMAIGPAFAQISETQTTTTTQVAPSLAPVAPDESVSKSVKSRTYNSDGSETKSSKSITRSGGGVSAQSRSETIAPDGSASVKEHERTVNPDGSSSSSTTTTETDR